MQKIIFLYGPSCAGKSTIAAEILKQKNIFHVHRDRLKWMISDYNRDNKDQRKLINEIMSKMIDIAINHGLSILLETPSLKLFEESRKKHENTCQIIPINVTADKEILKVRFLERIESAKKSGNKVSNKSLSVFLELYDKLNFQIEDATTINTSNISIAESLRLAKEIVG